jgi:deoxyribonuclease-4
MSCGCSLALHESGSCSSLVKQPRYEAQIGASFVRTDNTLTSFYQAYGLEALQAFLNPPDFNGPVQRISEAERQFILKREKRLYIHCPYHALLSSKSTRALNVIRDTLDTIRDLPAAAVMHLGYHDVNRLVEQIDRLQNEQATQAQPQQPAHLLLEVSAGKKGQLGSDPESLRHIVEGIDQTKHLGICLDTAHIFASGVSKLRNHEDVVKMFDKYEAILPIGLVHLNDSHSKYRSGIDSHANLGHGYIWGSGTDSLAALLQITKDIGIDCVCETSHEHWNTDQLLCLENQPL